MDSFELNKILGAVLGTCLVLLALNITAEAIFSSPEPEKPGYAIAAKGPGEVKPAEKKEEVPIANLLAKADAKKGEADTKVCHACHTFEKGGPNRVGPNLWGVVDRPKAGHPGFDYSAALKAKGGKWTYEDLNAFIRDPRGDIPGTKMTFAGVSRDTQRADIIAYLRTLSDNPVPLPEPKAAEKPPEQPKAAEAPKAPGTPPPAGEQKPPAAPPAGEKK